MKRIKLTVAAMVLFLLPGFNAFACAPEFDKAYFIRDTEEHFLAVPEGSFLFELRSLSGKNGIYKLPVDSVKHVAEWDIEDLKLSLGMVWRAFPWFRT